MDNSSLTYLFYTFSSRFKDIFEKKMVEIGLHSGQVFILQALFQEDGQSQSELCQNLRITHPTVFNLVSKLAKDEYVLVIKGVPDARTTRVFLTQKALDVADSIRQKWLETEVGVFGVLTETEKLMMAMLIEKLNANLRNSSDKKN